MKRNLKVKSKNSEIKKGKEYSFNLTFKFLLLNFSLFEGGGICFLKNGRKI